MIEIDIEKRRLNIIGVCGEYLPEEKVADILEERRKKWKPREPEYKKGVLRLFRELAASPMKGAYLAYEAD